MANDLLGTVAGWNVADLAKPIEGLTFDALLSESVVFARRVPVLCARSGLAETSAYHFAKSAGIKDERI